MPIYLTIHGKGIGEPGAGRWLDAKTFVFNESVVANEEGLRQIEFVLDGLGVELITTHSPGWVEYDRRRQQGHLARRHVPDGSRRPRRRARTASRELRLRALPDAQRLDGDRSTAGRYWDLACNAVTLAPGKVIMNAGSPTVVDLVGKLDIEVVQIDFSESHNFAIVGLHCARSNFVEIKMTADQNPDQGALG